MSTTSKQPKMIDWSVDQVFDAVKDGIVTRQEFIRWVYNRETEASDGGFQSGLDQAQYSAGWEY